MVQRDHARQQGQQRQRRQQVDPAELQLLHAGAARAAAIAAGVHGQRQLLGPAERAHEQRHQQRHHGLGPGDEVAGLKVRAAGLLGLHDLVRLVHQRGDEAQGDGHHHGDLVGREVNDLQRPEQRLQAVRQGDGGGGQRQQLGAHHQQDQAHRHEAGHAQAGVGDAYEADVHQLVARGLEEQVQYEGEYDDEEYGLQAADQELQVDPGGRGAGQHEGGDQQKARKALGHEHDGDQGDGGQQLGARVEPVYEGFAGEILAQRDVFQHLASLPPRRLSMIAAHTSSCGRRPPECQSPSRRSRRASFAHSGTSRPMSWSASSCMNTSAGVPE